MFVWRDFKENEKFKREKWRDSIFSSCLVGKGEGKKSGGAQVFTPHHFFFMMTCVNKTSISFFYPSLVRNEKSKFESNFVVF